MFLCVIINQILSCTRCLICDNELQYNTPKIIEKAEGEK